MATDVAAFVLLFAVLQLNSDEAVKRVLSGEKVDLKGKPSSTSKSQDKENREGREQREVSLPLLGFPQIF